MSGLITGVVSGLVVVFLAWWAKQVIFGRRLFLIQPRLFDYSDLVNAGTSKTIELTVFNGGLRSEEDIKVQLSPAFRYTVLASNHTGLQVDEKGILSIARLTPRQDFTVIMTAEGGEFRKEHVMGITSKETSGKIKENLQDAQITPMQGVMAVIVLFAILPVGYGVGKIVEKEVWPSLSARFSHKNDLSFRITNARVEDVNAGKKNAAAYSKTFEVVSASRKGDLVELAVRLRNPLSHRLEVTLISSSAAAEGRDKAGILNLNYLESDIFVFPGAEKTVTLIDYLPENVSPQLISLQVVIRSQEGRSDTYQDIELGVANPVAATK